MVGVGVGVGVVVEVEVRVEVEVVVEVVVVVVFIGIPTWFQAPGSPAAGLCAMIHAIAHKQGERSMVCARFWSWHEPRTHRPPKSMSQEHTISFLGLGAHRLKIYSVIHKRGTPLRTMDYIR